MCVENQRLQSYLCRLWTAVIASSNTVLQQRLPVTSSYQLPPLPPLDGMQISVTSQQNSKFNPFINSPPLTANVDTNRSAIQRISSITYRVSRKWAHIVFAYNFDVRRPIFIIFGKRIHHRKFAKTFFRYPPNVCCAITLPCKVLIAILVMFSLIKRHCSIVAAYGIRPNFKLIPDVSKDKTCKQ